MLYRTRIVGISYALVVESCSNPRPTRIAIGIPIGFPLYVPKNGVLGGFEGEDVKIMCSNPQKALPCVNARLLMHRVSKSVQRPEL